MLNMNYVFIRTYMKHKFQRSLGNWHWICFTQCTRNSDPTVCRSSSCASFSTRKYNDPVWQFRSWIIVCKAEVIDGIQR